MKNVPEKALYKTRSPLNPKDVPPFESILQSVSQTVWSFPSKGISQGKLTSGTLAGKELLTGVIKDV